MKIAGIFLVVERRGHEKSKAPKKEKSANPSFMPLWGRIRSTKKKRNTKQGEILMLDECFRMPKYEQNGTEHNVLEN